MRIAIIDNDDQFRLVCRLALQRLLDDASFVDAVDAASALSLLESMPLDLIIASDDLGGAASIEVLSRALHLQPSARRILVVAFSDPRLLRAAESRARIDGWLQKDAFRSDPLHLLEERVLPLIDGKCGKGERAR